MPPCPRYGQTTADNDGLYYCATCGIRFRFEEGERINASWSEEAVGDLAKFDWPYFEQTAKWGGARPETGRMFIVLPGRAIMSKTPIKHDWAMMIEHISEKLKTETRPEIRAIYEGKIAEWREKLPKLGSGQ